MTSVAERTRAAMDAITGLVGDPPPLPLPPPRTAGRRVARVPAPRHRLGGWLAPTLAAVAVLAIGISVAIFRVIPNGRVVPAAPTVTAPSVPKYYVALPGNMDVTPIGATAAIVGDTYSGKRLAVLPAPAGLKFLTVTGAGDDRTFVVGAARHARQFDGPTSWYLLRLSPGARHFATLRALPVAALPRGSVNAMALSPDGTRLAMMGPENGPTVGRGNRRMALRVYSVASGSLLRAWSAVLPWDLANGTALAWTTDGHVAWTYNWATDPWQNGYAFAIRTLWPADPGQDLVADARTVWYTTSTPGSGAPPFGLTCGGFGMLTGDGKQLICPASAWLSPTPTTRPRTACPAGPPVNAEGFQLYSLATRKPVGTLYRQQTNCYPLGPALLWASPSGDVVLGELTYGIPKVKLTIFRFGIVSNGRFWPLPTPPLTEESSQIAW
jgi:hypothetical protein